jgi:hypothetical protein
MNPSVGTRKPFTLLIGILLALLVLGAAGLVFFFVRMYQNDMRALEDFAAAYETYDQSIPSLKTGTVANDDVQKAGQTLASLKTRSAFRLSSLIKNEKEAMSTAQQIADLSAKEFDALIAYQQAAAGLTAEKERLLKALEDASARRRAAYAGFMELGK